MLNDLRDQNEAPTAVSQVPPSSMGNLGLSIHPGNLDEESSYDDEMWSKLPAWMRILDDLKRKARKTRPN